MKMRWMFAVLFALTGAVAVAAPQISKLQPAEGFTFSTTRVTITGSELALQTADCSNPSLPVVCPASVLFGSQPGTVLTVSPTAIVVNAPAHAQAQVDVTVQVTGGGSVTVTRAFSYNIFPLVSSADYNQYLLPAVAQNIPGVAGSLWTSEWMVFNGSSQFLPLVAYTCYPNVSPCPSSGAFPALSGGRVVPLRQNAGDDGAFIYLPKALDASIDMELRVRDLSRDNKGLGSEIPIIPATAFTNPVRLTDIPNDPRFRVALRVYGPTSSNPLPIHYRVLSVSANVLLAEGDAVLSTYAFVEDLPVNPSYAQLDPMSNVVRASSETSLRIEVSTPASQTLLWAMVSITNNDTQQVTIISPRR